MRVQIFVKTSDMVMRLEISVRYIWRLASFGKPRKRVLVMSCQWYSPSLAFLHFSSKLWTELSQMQVMRCRS